MEAKTLALTSASLVCFAANSLLCRGALAPPAIDAGTFTLIRIVAGALTLGVIHRAGREKSDATTSYVPAIALFVYAIAFSFAYLRLTTATGALILFGVVQLTMIVAGLRAGERPRALAWVGIAMAIAGLVALTLPGLSAPHPIGAALMATAGLAWGIYSLRGRGARAPIAMSARNFALATPLAVLAWLLSARLGVHVSARGAVLAATSGAITSGIGYSLWYAALRGLDATRAAVVQLSVPVIAAAAAIVFLGEGVSLRLAFSGTAILGGVALVLRAR